jgi:hypothetical protein
MQEFFRFAKLALIDQGTRFAHNGILTGKR